ncbi:MAG: hypothetical protein JST01_05700 [Cyanobacteria bacterium SZAS TMP-1]|nr:hypothetical protein [Cyanobacteria bacterium SZAS TMP-1]
MTSSAPQDRPDNKQASLDQGQSATGADAANKNLQAELHETLSLMGRAKTSNAGDQTQPAKPQEFNHDGFVGALVHNAAYTGIQETTKAVTQIADQITGGNAADKVNLVSKPLAAEYKSAEWYGEQFGGAVGKLAPFLAAFAVTRGASAKMGLNATLEGAAERAAMFSRNDLILTGQSAVAGFASESIFTANQGPKRGFADFATERMKNGLIGGVDMAALTAGTIGLKNLSTTAAKDSPLLGAILRNPAAGATIAGYPIGMVSADMHAGLFEKRFATAQEREQSAYGMAVVGFGLGAIHGKVTEGSIDRVKNPTITDVLKGNAERGYQHFDNFMASINPLLMENRLAYAPAGARPPLRNMAMQATMSDLKSNVMFRDGDAAPSTSKGGGELPTLKSALHDLNLGEVADFVARDKVLKNQKVVRSLGGEGNDSPAVLELAPSKAFPDGGALKVTIPEGGWESDWGHRPFDAKLLTQVHEVELNGTGFSGTANVYVQELVDVMQRYDPALVAKFDALMEKAGMDVIDPGSGINGQMGVSRKTGRLVLIDYPSAGKPGGPDTLREIREGARGQEEEWAAEDQRIKEGKSEQEDHGHEMEAVDVEREARRQAGMETGKFTPNELDVLGQLNMGESPKDVLMYYALIEGKTLPNGMPDMKGAKNPFDALVRRAQEAGVLEKKGKKAKMADEDY